MLLVGPALNIVLVVNLCTILFSDPVKQDFSYTYNNTKGYNIYIKIIFEALMNFDIIVGRNNQLNFQEILHMQI